MGQMACRHSDIAIITSDNPRSENPDAIIQDICEGLGSYQRLEPADLLSNPFLKGYLVEVDRKNALALAVAISLSQDTIVAAGKGHETYQITHQGKISFDDVKELEADLQKEYQRFTPIAWRVQDLCQALEVTPEFPKKARLLFLRASAPTPEPSKAIRCLSP